MKKLLVLFSNAFPYNIGEPFLEAECPLYREYFDGVLLSAACKRGEKPTRNLDGIAVLEDYTLSRDIPSMLSALGWVLGDKMFYRELKNLWAGGFTPRKLYRLMVFSLCGNHRARQVWRWLKQHPEYDQVVLYSYWLHIPAYGAVRLKQKLKKGWGISRAHGFDLYLERYPDRYIPFHSQMVAGLDEVAAISKNGKEYLQRAYGEENKISVYHLGAIDHGKHNPLSERTPLRLLTCSRTVPLKRLHRIVDTLCLMGEREIKWTHIGGGEAQASLVAYAKEKLPGNITATFTDTVPNEKIYEIYGQTPFHVFINVSETEGVPVSIMEAMSFDIPVIATDVGGTSELVCEGVNGFLLPVDFQNEQLKERLLRLMDMDKPQYMLLREGARRSFAQGWDAEKNYRGFLKHIAEAGEDCENHRG